MGAKAYVTMQHSGKMPYVRHMQRLMEAPAMAASAACWEQMSGGRMGVAVARHDTRVKHLQGRDTNRNTCGHSAPRVSAPAGDWKAPTAGSHGTWVESRVSIDNWRHQGKGGEGPPPSGFCWLPPRQKLPAAEAPFGALSVAALPSPA